MLTTSSQVKTEQNTVLLNMFVGFFQYSRCQFDISEHKNKLVTNILGQNCAYDYLILKLRSVFKKENIIIETIKLNFFDLFKSPHGNWIILNIYSLQKVILQQYNSLQSQDIMVIVTHQEQHHLITLILLSHNLVIPKQSENA